MTTMTHRMPPAAKICVYCREDCANDPQHDWSSNIAAPADIEYRGGAWYHYACLYARKSRDWDRTVRGIIEFAVRRMRYRHEEMPRDVDPAIWYEGIVNTMARVRQAHAASRNCYSIAHGRKPVAM